MQCTWLYDTMAEVRTGGRLVTEQNILRLQVAVHQPMPVHVRHGHLQHQSGAAGTYG